MTSHNRICTPETEYVDYLPEAVEFSQEVMSVRFCDAKEPSEDDPNIIPYELQREGLPAVNLNLSSR